MWSISRRFSAAVSLCAVLLVAAPPGGATTMQAPDRSAASGIVARHGFADAEIGFVLRDLATGVTLAQHRPEAPLIPASVSKVGTAVAALEILGAEHRFVTALLIDGDIADGILRGSVYLRGGGDPLLDNGALRGLAERLASLGVRRVEGRFVYDESALPAYSRIDTLQPDAASYNPGISALSLNFNRVELQWRRERGDSFVALTHAISDGLSVPIESFTFTAASMRLPGGAPFVRGGSQAGSAPADAEEADWIFDPAIADKGYAWLPVHEAGVAAARVFRTIATGAGIALPEPEAGITPPGTRMVAAHEGRPVVDLVRLLLRHSNNLTGELLGLAAASRLAGEVLPLDRASAAIALWAAARLQPAGWADYAPLNFSGLTSSGRMSPNHAAALLDHGAQRDYAGASLVDLMPARAVEVSEQVRVKVKPTKKNPSGTATVTRSRTVGSTYAKTGTMAYVRGLAGYLDAASGRRLVFAIFVNDPVERRAMDESAAVLSPVPPPASRRWLGRARAVEQALLKDWAQRY